MRTAIEVFSILIEISEAIYDRILIILDKIAFSIYRIEK